MLSRDTAWEMGIDRLDAGYGLGLRRVASGDVSYVGHSGSMPGFLASLFVDQHSGDGVIALANGTTGLAADALPRHLLHDSEPAEQPAWEPTVHVPATVEAVLGLWFWGNTAIELRWHNERLEARVLQSGGLLYTFGLVDGRLVGLTGYHRGETLHVHPDHLECATFIYTRIPYDPAAPIPGL